MGIAAPCPACGSFIFRGGFVKPAALFSFCGIFLSGAGCLLINVIPLPVFKLAGLILLYLGGSFLLLNVCSFQICTALFACGIGVTILLGLGQRGKLIGRRPHDKFHSDLYFRLLLTLIMGILSYTGTELLRFWIPVRQTILFISMWVGLAGLISLCLDDELLFRCISLQAICLVFTITYLYMENAVLIFAFFSAINLLMAFGGSVLVMGGSKEPETLPEEMT